MCCVIQVWSYRLLLVVQHMLLQQEHPWFTLMYLPLWLLLSVRIPCHSDLWLYLLVSRSRLAKYWFFHVKLITYSAHMFIPNYILKNLFQEKCSFESYIFYICLLDLCFFFFLGFLRLVYSDIYFEIFILCGVEFSVLINSIYITVCWIWVFFKSIHKYVFKCVKNFEIWDKVFF